MKSSISGMVRVAVAQALIHRRRIDDFAGVHDAFRVERRFELFERPVNLLTKQSLVEMASRETIAVLAAHGAAETKRLYQRQRLFLAPLGMPPVDLIDRRRYRIARQIHISFFHFDQPLAEKGVENSV